MCTAYRQMRVYTSSWVSADLHVCIYAFGICKFVWKRRAHLYKGLYSNSSRATPVAVARTERIQKLSWQKLQYWMIARMVAQHKNMVTWRKEDQSLKWLYSAKYVKLLIIESRSYVLKYWCSGLADQDTKSVSTWPPDLEMKLIAAGHTILWNF